MKPSSIVDFRLNLADDLRSDWELVSNFSSFFKMLEKNPLVIKLYKEIKPFQTWLEPLSLKEKVMILSVVAMDQGDTLFTGWEKVKNPESSIRRLAETLFKVELFYEPIGGLIGYAQVILKLLRKRTTPLPLQNITHPPLIDLKDKKSRKYYLAGLKALPKFAEVYPVGGAGDRLNLRDPATGEALPQAKLIFEEKNLLEGLIRDLKAREKLYEKIYSKKIITPVALMTSSEKNNTRHIIEILEENDWFNRPKESFYLFEQPLVPVITEEGAWSASSPFEPTLKPGGHGILWLLMEEYRVFNWLKSFKRDYLLIRQINNPLADLDGNLLALAGYGIKEKKGFGFLTCPRLVKSSEGMNVLISSHNEDGYHSTITNIEYTDFSERGIEDKPLSPNSPYSLFPANTNILYASVKEVKKILPGHPLPGMILNMKGEFPVLGPAGTKMVRGGRLESTMQNIADAMTVATSTETVTEKELNTFALFNPREKTISVTKREMKKGENLSETPLQAWLDKQKENIRFFTESCGFEIGENSIITYDPSLGPLYEIISQKVIRGKLEKGSELKIEGSEIKIENIAIDGSLRISNPQGSCTLSNVKIINKGIDNRKKNTFWQKVEKIESCEIILEGTSEFLAQDLELSGDLKIVVPDGFKVTAKKVKGKLKLTTTKLKKEPWKWSYSIKNESSIVLTFNK